MAAASTAVDFTTDEARALLALIDLAVKAAGLKVAEAASVLAAKIAPAAEAKADAPLAGAEAH